ncbi:hypothetical protein HYX00_02710 [Candidatus Woesearchaeota archaeon]|nr:hypothetical protein [Candidatus Woesearchaeota archaeon]
MYIFKKRQRLRKNNGFYSKAQTSFFVILGIIIFITAITGYFVYNNIKKAKIEEEAKEIADLSLQSKEIEKFVNDCLRKESFDALKKLGQTGGYIEIPKLIRFDNTSFWYLSQANIQPFLNQTQERLIEYINVNLPKCVDNGNLSKFGFLVEKGKPLTFIEFGNSDVTLKVIYPIKLSKEKFTKEFSEYFTTFSIRYRSIFEAASEINEKLFDADFDVKDPFKKLGYLRNLELDISYKTLEKDVMVFTIIDRRSITPANEFYTFNFAAKLGNSDLKKATYLQNNSAVNPTFLPYTIYSVDKKAQLDISEGTTISLNSQSVPAISVQQNYTKEVVTKDVPVYKKNNQIIQRQDIKYSIDNPVYDFEPSGLLFNKFQRLTLYYDNETKAEQGVGILMGKNGFWVPIPSKHEPEQKRVFTQILGFTHFTAVNCATQQVKRAIAEHFFKPSGTCFVSLAIFVIVAIASAVLFFAAAAPGSFSVVGGSVVPTAQAAEIAAAGAAEIATAGAAATIAPATFPATIGASLASTVGVTTLSVAAATALGIAYTGLYALSLLGTVLGATTDVFYSQAPDNCQTFYPVCDQNIHIIKEQKDGSGMCVPQNGARVAAGQPVNVCAQVKKCNTIRKFLCMPCSVKCTASFV